MFTLDQVLYEMERRKNEIILAQEARLLPKTFHYQRWLTNLGTQLVSWGEHLQTRYADPLPPPVANRQQA